MSDAMMSADEMNELKAAKGTAFDRLFLTLMIQHHEGAIPMATKEQKSGQNGMRLPSPTAS